MSLRILVIGLLLGSSLSVFAQSSEDGNSTKQRKLVHKKPAASPPIDMNPPKTSESNASSQSLGSEYLHQAASENFEVTAGGDYQSIKFNLNDSGAPSTSAQQTVTAVKVQAEYGFTDLVSGGVSFSYNSLWLNFSPAGSSDSEHGFGMADPALYIKGRINFDSSSLRLGGALNISLAKHYIGSDSQNFYSGGQSLDPVIGYEYYYGDHTFGTTADYKLYLGSRSITTDTASGDFNGGNALTLAVFYEYNLTPMKIGLDFNAKFIDPVTVSGSGGSEQYTGSEGQYTFEVYAPILIADSLTLVPKGAFGWTGSHDIVSSSTLWGASLLARYAF